MKSFLGFSVFILATSAAYACDWTEAYLIPNDNKLSFQECKEDKKLKINDLVVIPNIEFEVVHEYYPEGNTIWSTLSPDQKTAVVWLSNRKGKLNAWVINLSSKKVEMFTDHSEGHHFNPKFISNDKFIIVHAGMGYRVDYQYERTSGLWENTGKKVHDVEM